MPHAAEVALEARVIVYNALFLALARTQARSSSPPMEASEDPAAHLSRAPRTPLCDVGSFIASIGRDLRTYCNQARGCYELSLGTVACGDAESKALPKRRFR